MVAEKEVLEDESLRIDCPVLVTERLRPRWDGWTEAQKAEELARNPLRRVVIQRVEALVHDALGRRPAHSSVSARQAWPLRARSSSASFGPALPAA